LFTVLAAVASVESSGIDVVQRVNSGAVPEQSFDLAAGRTVLKQRVFVHHVQLPQVMVLYALNLPPTTRRVKFTGKALEIRNS